jgi:hypothetical protein
MARLNVDIKDNIYMEFLEQVGLDGRSTSDVVRELVLKWLENRILEKDRLSKIKEGNNG